MEAAGLEVNQTTWKLSGGFLRQPEVEMLKENAYSDRYSTLSDNLQSRAQNLDPVLHTWVFTAFHCINPLPVMMFYVLEVFPRAQDSFADILCQNHRKREICVRFSENTEL